MREKKRAIIIASILSLIFILSAVWTAHQFLAKQEAASAAIYQNGTLIKIISTGHEETFRIEDGENWNEITVDKDGIHVSGASCPDKICMHTVWRGKGSLPIVCLPNHLVITAAPEETDDEFDVLTYYSQYVICNFYQIRQSTTYIGVA